MKSFRTLTVLALLAAFSTPAVAQEAEDRTLLPWEQMRAIMNESSGERAMHHVLELVPYPRVRSRAEYEGHFRESEVMARFAKEYGFSDVEIESFQAPGRIWHASRVELWMQEPDLRKLYDVHDVAVSIAANSEPGDVTAELIDVGAGSRPENYAGKDVTGKIVLGSAGTNVLQRLAVFERGAVGVVTYTALRPELYPDPIMSQSLSARPPEGKAGGFGWSVAASVGRDLAARLAAGRRIVLRSIVESETFPGEMETVHATIPGDGSTTQAVAISAHLYEGYQKQGANDDNSGCALTLEIGRTLITLIHEGKLPRPKRTIHFIWVPEISGTTAWLAKHADMKARLVADLNFDMEGLGLSLSHSYWVLHRTPDTFPTFLNDVAQNVMEFVAELNRERVRYRANGYAPTWPLYSPNGSHDPFYIKIDKHYGASDHVVYMREGIPSVMFITWPDMFYHSSEDTPDKLDPTMFRRAAAVGGAGAVIVTAGSDALAARVTAEALARGAERMGDAQRKGLGYLADAAAPADFAAAYREAQTAVRHQASVEKEVVRSSAVLYHDPAAAAGRLAPIEALVDRRAGALLDEVQAYYRLQAALRGVPATEPPPTPLEQEAARLVVERATTPGQGGRGGFGGFGGQAAAAVPQHMRAELNILLGQPRTVLEIRDFLSGEFEPLPLDTLMSYVRAMEKAGAVTLTQRQ